MDKYVIDQYLAEGGMGAIYLGKKLGAGGFEKQVVLKQLLPEFTKQPEFIDLFLREARLSATLDHANITHTIDLVSTGKDHFIVMEFVDGDDLRSLFKKAKKRKTKISVAAGIFIAQETLSALAYAHKKRGPDNKPLKLIHRDISPSNILVSKNGEVKLTDFGIAKAATHNSVFYRVKGKVGYMSPEQAKSESLDPRSDLYSLAVCFYEMITGERLFVSQGITTSAEELYSQPIPRVSEKVPGAPKTLDDIFFKALALNPADRYQDAGLFQEALLKCAHKHGLFMSSRSLATHLDETCYSSKPRVGGKSMDDFSGTFDNEGGTEQLDMSERSGVSSVDDFIMVGETIIRESEQKLAPDRNGLTQLGDFQGKELTSIIAPDISHLLDEGNEPLEEFENFESLSELNEVEDKSDYDEEIQTAPNRGSGDFEEELKTIAIPSATSSVQELNQKPKIYEPRTIERVKPARIKTVTPQPSVIENAPNEDPNFRHDQTPLPQPSSRTIGSPDSWLAPADKKSKESNVPKGKPSESAKNIGFNSTVAMPPLNKLDDRHQLAVAPTPPALVSSAPQAPAQNDSAQFDDQTFGDFFDQSQANEPAQTPAPKVLSGKKPGREVNEIGEFNHFLAITCLVLLTLATVLIVGFNGTRLDF